MKAYRVLMHPNAYRRAEDYLAEIRRHGITAAGTYLQEVLRGQELSTVGTEAFLEHLVATKRPQIFAEMAVFGDGNDWNATELSILGDIGIAVRVTVYDDGRYHHPGVHQAPFPATLLFTPGALLLNGRNRKPADWDEVTKGGKIDQGGYQALYERRLLPLLVYTNEQAAAEGKKALVTVPGIGCGHFAGPFQGQLGEHLKAALIALLSRHAGRLQSIHALYYDPYRECKNERHDFCGVLFLVRPLMQGNQDKPQLCEPARYQEPGDDFTGCRLFSIVAWDHVSWPGNDFYTGSRATDDGVKAAATDSMRGITGVAGTYDARDYKYNPPQPYTSWQDLVVKKGVRLAVEGNLRVLPAP